MIIRTYHKIISKITQLLPEEHAYRQRNLAGLMTGMFHANSIHLSKVALYIPSSSQVESVSRRLTRFLKNCSVKPRGWYESVATKLIEKAATNGCVRLIIDGSKVTTRYQLLMVALAFRNRALPISWTWVRGAKGHSSTWKQQSLLAYAKTLIPEDVDVELLADSEFTPLQSVVIKWGWDYVLRHKGSHLYREKGHSTWKALSSLVSGPGEQVWLEDVELTGKHKHRCNVLAYWAEGEKEPWLLATSLSSPKETIKEYKYRMWIEEMFGDFKGNGVDLEKSRLKDFLRLSRLTLAVALLYVWVVAFGSAQIKNGNRKLVDRTDRRDLSIYRIGHDLLKRYLVNGRRFTLRDVPYFC